MSVRDTDFNSQVAAFATYLNTNKESSQNLTNENLELLSKFTEFLKTDKYVNHKHDHRHGHGNFGKHGHHGILGHHFGKRGLFGKHGPYGKHGQFGKHGHGHGHGHGHKRGHGHGHKHGHGHGHGHHGYHSGRGCDNFNSEKHGYFGNFGPDSLGKHFDSIDCSKKHGKHHKIFWKWAMLHEPCKNRASGVCVITEPTAVEGASQEDKDENACDNRPRRDCRGRGHWLRTMCPYKRDVTAPDQPAEPQAETSVPQENLAEMVEHISIANSPSPQKE